MRKILAIAALLALAAPALANEAPEKPKDVDSMAASQAIKRFKVEFKTEDIDFKLDAVMALAKVQHPSVAKMLAKHLKNDDPHVRRAAAKGLGEQPTSAKMGGSKLLKLIRDSAQPPKVIATSIDSIAKLRYTKSIEQFERMMDHDEDGVVIAIFRAYGLWKEDQSLKKMYQWWDTYPDEKDFHAVSVTVDTGTAGNKDQKAAQAKGKAMLAKQNKWKHRPRCTAALRKALKQITGLGFRRPEDLKSFLDEPRKYKDPEKVVERKDEAARKAIYKALVAIEKASLDHATDKVPDDDKGAERGKIYWGVLRKARRKMLEKEEITLSELDVILEEAETKGWPKR